ncbi:hypothetical protein CROQUDRAFT_88196 [Cronartium quercuum f. sp. fusiforme G11]|uniref:Uncharacterized protein n=1 Tax=Cronartium quercuum f. sp. fusiforme G11 TaxID=708437 RepID=A0A9P6NN20_9BASI|nr:hypothetical protein CROQUDRAFT_88196 [Cronartium quercuum f. sp. fusiforme G11]
MDGFILESRRLLLLNSLENSCRCIMWGSIAKRVRAVWDPIFRKDVGCGPCRMPSGVGGPPEYNFCVIRNRKFLSFLPIIYILAQIQYSAILNPLNSVIKALRSPSENKGTQPFSWVELRLISQRLSDPSRGFPSFYFIKYTFPNGSQARVGVASEIIATHHVFGIL